ncbi:MAG: hypothetical protein V4754_05515 [Pseudomonadota bacterium]
MTTYEQGTPGAANAGNSQGTTGADRQGEQNFVLVDPEQGLEIGDESFIPTEVRRVERAGNRQSGDGGDSVQQSPDVTGSTGV